MGEAIAEAAPVEQVEGSWSTTAQLQQSHRHIVVDAHIPIKRNTCNAVLLLKIPIIRSLDISVLLSSMWTIETSCLERYWPPHRRGVHLIETNEVGW